jgi:hypothetical protein
MNRHCSKAQEQRGLALQRKESTPSEGTEPQTIESNSDTISKTASTEIITETNSGTIINAKTVNINIDSRPGWAFNWPEPKGVLPFPNLELTTEMLISTLKTLTDEEIAKCIRGDTEIALKFQLALLKQVHSNPAYMNILGNPSSRDKVITFQKDFWQIEPICGALKTLNNKFSDKLDIQQKLLSRDVNTGAIAALSKQIRSTPLNKQIKNEFDTYFKNIEIQQGQLTPHTGSTLEIRPFSLRNDEHIGVINLCLCIKQVAHFRDSTLDERIREEQLTTPGRSEIVHGALIAFINLISHHLENFNFIPSKNSVYIKYAEWEQFSCEEAIARMVSSYLKIICEYLRSKDGDFMISLANYIDSIMETQIAFEVSTRRILSVFYENIDDKTELIKQNAHAFPML